jgi:uncharacterized membrane protein YhhN
MDWKPLVPVLFLMITISAALTIRSRYLEPPSLMQLYIFKPLTILLILTVALPPGSFLTAAYAGAICLGLLFSLAGDVWLMVPGNRILAGLVCFLFAHVSYLTAFLSDTPASGFPWAAVPLGAVGILLYVILWPGLSGGLRPAVGVYVVVITAMATAAVHRAGMLPSTGSLSAAIGALLFMGSDALLAGHRFRRSLRLGHVLILGSYYLGQLLIALSVGGGVFG